MYSLEWHCRKIAVRALHTVRLKNASEMLMLRWQCAEPSRLSGWSKLCIQMWSHPGSHSHDHLYRTLDSARVQNVMQHSYTSSYMSYVRWLMLFFFLFRCQWIDRSTFILCNCSQYTCIEQWCRFLVHIALSFVVFDHPREAAWYIILVVSVCLSVCQMI